MFKRSTALLAIVCALAMVASFAATASAKGRYLVQGSGGPGPGSPAEAAGLLENVVIPSFEMIMKWEKDGKVIGGLPAGDRAIVMIVEAESNDEVDRMLRGIPLWPLLQWKVTPLQSVAARAEMERKNVAELKAKKM